MKRLENKTAVITGGNSGIGLEAAVAFAREGARVVIFGRNPETVDTAVERIGEGAIGVAGDVSDEADLARLFDTVRQAHGGIDVLVANAGVAFPRPFEQVDREFFDHVFSVNVSGAYFTVQQALPLLREGASVVLTTSTLDSMGEPGLSVYSASKAALRSVARTLASELAPRGVRVNTIAPGPVETPIYDRMGLDAGTMKDFGAHILSRVPAKRFGKPEEIAAPMVFLASADSAYMTGAELTVDGGMGQV